MTTKKGRRAVLCILLVAGVFTLTSCQTHYAVYTKNFSRTETVDMHRKLVQNSSQAAFAVSAVGSLCGALKGLGPWMVAGCAVYVGANAARARDILILAYQRGQCFRLEYLVPKPQNFGGSAYWSMASATCTLPSSGGNGSGGGSW